MEDSAEFIPDMAQCIMGSQQSSFIVKYHDWPAELHFQYKAYQPAVDGEQAKPAQSPIFIIMFPSSAANCLTRGTAMKTRGDSACSSSLLAERVMIGTMEMGERWLTFQVGQDEYYDEANSLSGIHQIKQFDD